MYGGYYGQSGDCVRVQAAAGSRKEGAIIIIHVLKYNVCLQIQIIENINWDMYY